MMIVMLSACSHHKDDEPSDGDTVLTLYVYSPEHPAVTRANTGYVDASYDERRIDKLQIWVFRTGTNELVGYLSPGVADRDELNTVGNKAFRMVVEQSFAFTPTNVDVYVLANITQANSGLSFDASTTRSELEAAMMGTTGTTGGNTDPFGLATLTTSVPTDGLPMSGVLRNQPVVGEAPVLRIGTTDEMATVQLVRMVSKVRFVFSRSSDSEELLDITGIALNENMIPQDEYVFLNTPYDERTAHVGAGYISERGQLLTNPLRDSEIGKPDDPGKYVYIVQEAQDYEELINSGLEAGELTQVGPFYLRETDKRLSGTISYTLNGGATKQATFSVAAAGDFSRNHTWIVYAHYGTAILDVVTVELMDWRQVTSDPRTVYNW